MSANSSLSQLEQESVQIHTEERGGENCSLANTILHREGTTFHGVPSNEAGLVPIHVDEKTQGHFRKVSVFQLLEERIKVDFVKSFRKVQQATVNT